MQDNKVKNEIKELLSRKEQIQKDEIDRVIILVKETDALKYTMELKNKFINKADTALDTISNVNYNNISKDLLKLL